MKDYVLTHEQQEFAELHHGLLLAFMSRYHLDQDLYDVLALRYLKTVVRYNSDSRLQQYAFSTILWKHLRSALSHELKRAARAPVEVSFDDLYRPPPAQSPDMDRLLWEKIEERLTYKQAEAVLLRNQGYSNQEIGSMCGVSRKAIEKRFHRIRKLLSSFDE